MGKKRKTLKQKRLTELRRLKESQHSSSITSTQEENVHAASIKEPKFSYSFSTHKEEKMVTAYSLQHDLKKTIMVSGIVLILLVSFSVLLQTNAFVLPLIPRY